MSTALAVLGVVVFSFVLGLACGALADEVDSRRHLRGNDVIGGATAVGVFALALFVGLVVVL